MLQSRKKQIEEDECDVSWYKEMAGESGRCVTATVGQYLRVQRELKSWTVQYSHSLCVFPVSFLSRFMLQVHLPSCKT